MSWHVYILECADGTLYTGVTNDLERRIEEHNGSTIGAKYTRARRPVMLKYAHEEENRSAAQREESRIKLLSRKEKQSLIRAPNPFYMNHAKDWYRELRKPSFAPPAWVFDPVWSMLYLVIALSFGFVAYQTYVGNVPLSILALFIANLVTNFAFSPIQFRLRNLILASIDIVLVLVSLVLALRLIYEYYPWVAFVNLPYLAWVSFATFLQLSITYMNPEKRSI